ncbi:MAG: HEAT repeat domain-containing protein [Candidatus Acidiferrales bacterium]
MIGKIKRLINLFSIPALVFCASSSAFVLPVSAQQSQQPQEQKLPYAVDRANVADALAKVESGQFSAVHVDLITRARCEEATPILKEQFAQIQDPMLKDKVAAALVRLGSRDDIYWDYLLNQAKVALDSDAPPFLSYDSTGKSTNGPSPEFEAWRMGRSSPQDTETAGADSMYIFPGRITTLAWSEDPRAIPYLRQGLSSPNPMIQTAAAYGLAELGDEASIPLIIAACEKAPKEVSSLMAESLIYFDNNTAQKAADKFVAPGTAQAIREQKASGQRQKPLTVPLYDSTTGEHP